MSAQDLPLLESQQQLVSRLQNLFDLSAPFAMLAGDQGSGRTTICQQWLAAASPAGRCVVLNCLPGLTLSRLREQLVSALLPGAIFDPDDSLVDSLFRLLGEQSRLLLVIDDADQAPEGWLQELWELYCINEALPAPHRLSVLLCATPAWVMAGSRTLQGHPLPPVELDVEPLSTAEQTGLLEFCLRRGNYYALMPNPAALAERLHHCAGNPGRVVALAEDIMTRKSTLKSNDWLSNKMLASIGVAAAVVILLSWVLPPLFKGGAPSSSTAPAASAAVPTGTVVEPTASSAAAAATPDATNTGALPNEVSGAGDAAAVGEHGSRRVVIADQVVRDIMTSQQGGSGAVASGKAEPAVSGAVTSVDQLAPVAAELSGSGAAQTAPAAAAAVGSTKSHSKATKNESTKVEHKAPAKVESKAKPEAKAKPAIKAKPEAAAKPVSQPATVAVSGSQGQPAELKAKSGQRYALQLTASSERAAVLNYALKHSPGDRFWIYQTAHDGKPWFVLVQGDYASSVQAKAAVASLPAALQAGHPWPKSFAQIQKEMN